jgi:hypothetical protein
MNLLHVTQNIFGMYYEGFKNMKPLGRKLWLIIGIKFIIFFLIMKILFFPNVLKTHFSNDTDRANHVINSLIQRER